MTVADGHRDDTLARRFADSTPHLRAVAYRMLGSVDEADDAVQEAWLRLHGADTSGVDNLTGWLTTVTARVCLDMLRARGSRREQSLDADAPAVPDAATVRPGAGGREDPEQSAVLAESVGAALVVVLETLAPAERLAFVLHDMFAVPFEEIAAILDRSPAAARQLASRARRRVRARPPTPDTDVSRKRRVVDAFLAASREGRFDDLVSLLDPDVVLRGDATAARMGGAAYAAAAGAGGAEPMRGSVAVARFLSGRARGAVPAVVDGAAAAVAIAGGRVRVALTFAIRDDQIVGIDVIADPEQLRALDVEILG